MAIEFGLLVLGAYLVGSIPSAYIAARVSRKIDLREQGDANVGATNLLRLTSIRITIAVVLFDLAKGALMVLVAWLLGLDTAQQAMVGLAAIIGHNWPVFLGFHGGRGVLTTIGLSVALPPLNGLVPWELVAFLLVAAFGIFILRNPPLGIISAVAAMPIVSFGVSEPLDLTLGFTGMLLVVVTKRLVAPRTPFTCKVSLGQLLLNRLILDRDIWDREAWIRYVTREIKSTSQEKAE